VRCSGRQTRSETTTLHTTHRQKEMAMLRIPLHKVQLVQPSVVTVRWDNIRPSFTNCISMLYIHAAPTSCCIKGLMWVATSPNCLAHLEVPQCVREV